MLTLNDRVFLALLMTLGLAVLVIEYRNKRDVPSLAPTRHGARNYRDLNVPWHRVKESAVPDVGFISPDDASQAGAENA